MREGAVVRRKLRGNEVLAMVEAGILDADEAVELLDGELVQVSPQGPEHASVTAALAGALERHYGARFVVRAHSPVVAGEHSLPEPDVVVARGSHARYVPRHPGAGDVVLVVEVSSTSRRTDHRKGAIYGAAGYETYWRLDLRDQRLETFAGPSPNGGYAQVGTFGLDDLVALPGSDVTVPLRTLLP